jgi:KaiC/GvpD/RAD55 family RecA-like ATPase
VARVAKTSKRDELEDQLALVRSELEDLKSKVSGLKIPTPSGQDRVKTYIEGFDEVLGGGIPAGHVVLLAGPSGTMKSSLALNLIHANHANGEAKGVFVSLEEGRDSLLRTMESLGLKMDSEDAIVDVGKMRLEHEEAGEARDWFKVMQEYLERRVQTNGVSIVVVDSLTSLFSLSEVEDVRDELFRFFGFLRGLGCTSILVSEWPDEKGFPCHEDYLADGVLLLNFRREERGEVFITIRCAKMRHSAHSRAYYVLTFSDGKFRVEPMG